MEEIEKREKLRGLLYATLFVFFIGAILLLIYRHYYPKTNVDNINLINKEFGSPTPRASASAHQTSSTLPDKALVRVPFTVQAPNANWDAVHEEACEEASLIMVKHFIEGTEIGTPDQADAEILELINWEGENGYKVDVTLAELNNIAQSHYGMTTGRVEKGITADQIKHELASGKPVIIGAAGKILPNPNFKDGGPNYHMLVITGYDSQGFITNDPGTRNGLDFRYTVDALMNAIHDWDATNILDGGKNYLVFD